MSGHAFWTSARPETIPRWTASTSIRHIEGSSLVLIGSVSYPFSPKWAISATSQYDFLNNTDLDSKLTIRRSFHTWNVDFILSRDESENETSFTVAVSTYAFGQDQSASGFPED